MQVLRDARVLMALARGAGGPGSHADRMARFYGPQADDYDRFRERLLKGRRELIDVLPVRRGARIVELGGGTGRNLEFFGGRLDTFARVDLVDICPPLVAVAQRRLRHRPNVCCTVADATSWRPVAPVDAVYLSYALTMIPRWREVLDNAADMLVPGGVIGVVDFHVGAHHSRFTRAFWPRWFAHDGVHLNPHHLSYLRRRFTEVHFQDRRAVMPYLCGLTAPYFLFVGRSSV